MDIIQYLQIAAGISIVTALTIATVHITDHTPRMSSLEYAISGIVSVFSGFMWPLTVPVIILTLLVMITVYVGSRAHDSIMERLDGSNEERDYDV